jgi:hypothetical protein
MRSGTPENPEPVVPYVYLKHRGHLAKSRERALSNQGV